MPRFITISPTHLSGTKPEAWQRFLSGGYVALGWNHTDYTNWSLERIIADIKAGGYKNETEAIHAHTCFFNVEVGDVVAVNNTLHSLFGIGLITSDYLFEQQMHDTGHADTNEFYSHYRTVEWLVTEEVRSGQLLEDDEVRWRTRGTISVLDGLPPFIIRFLDKKGITLQPTSVDWEGDHELIGYEGKMMEELRLHKWIERDRLFIQKVKYKLRNVIGCMACDMNPLEKFGIEAIQFLEAHHITPLSLRKSESYSLTPEKDIALICPNCHRWAHWFMANNQDVIMSLEAMRQLRGVHS